MKYEITGFIFYTLVEYYNTPWIIMEITINCCVDFCFSQMVYFIDSFIIINFNRKYLY